MTDESDQIPPPKRQTRRSQEIKRQRDAVKDAMADRAAVAPLLNPGPGRKPILDPDQTTLDENMRRLHAGLPAIDAGGDCRAFRRFG